VIGFELRRGDVVSMETPGGGGHGDPRERDPAALAADLADGYVTSNGAAAYVGDDTA
jgi:N-methylhydantoinase B